MSCSQLQHGKVYRFRYTDQRFRDRGIRTALFLGDDGTGTYSGLSVKCLDLEKGEYRNFIPRSMADIQAVTCDVGYVNVGKLSSNLVSGVVKTWEGAGYTVFRDGDHVNAVKGWEKPKYEAGITPVNGGFFVNADETTNSRVPVGVYYHGGELRVWTQDRQRWNDYGSNLANLRELYKALREYLKGRE
jgi:hypothetical protein